MSAADILGDEVDEHLPYLRFSQRAKVVILADRFAKRVLLDAVADGTITMELAVAIRTSMERHHGVVEFARGVTAAERDAVTAARDGIAGPMPPEQRKMERDERDERHR
jgi:adenosine deaminase